ncbi:chemotaxis protein CheR [Saprospira sp. CCB-QB6]|uniref:CheR family methyltransferase n=1 Tax=Saprospira sp. CCB-QB6 TaxID=3023936 RepID=UPI00234A5373|nr:CheR family methyltransferase [Saprospira sp. CCB-QB6]WCL80765.1 chemotaxis protein CheR [Saprospira sp. CCB-QB6]
MMVRTEEIDSLLSGLANKFGADFKGYSPSFLNERVELLMEEERISSIFSLWSQILRNADLGQKTIRFLQARENSFFHPLTQWKHFKKLLEQRNIGQARILYMQIGQGEGLHSLVLFLEEMGISAKIEATDVDPSLLKVAKRAEYPDLQKQLPIKFRLLFPKGDYNKYLSSSSRNRISSRWQKNLSYSSRNFVKMAPDRNRYDLIICSEVIKRYNESSRLKILDHCHKGLKKGGLLCLGHQDTIYENVPFEALGMGIFEAK